MNRRGFFFFLALACAPLFAACVYSVHPLYSDSDSFSEPRILGKWEFSNQDGKVGQVVIRQGTKNNYEAVSRDPDSGRDSVYEFHLVRIGAELFEDVSLPTDQLSEDMKGSLKGVAEVHYFYKVSIDANTMRLASLKQEWLVDQIASKQIVIRHKNIDQFTLALTASPFHLREFMKQIAATEGAFEQDFEFHREQ